MLNSLKPYNTFGVEAHCSRLLEITSAHELIELLSSGTLPEPYLFLGGGSNVLFKSDWPGTVLLNRIKGVRVEWMNDQEALLFAGSGENWHQLVLKSLEFGLGGIENLSLIPGTAGAAPMQNIGAYGVELKDTFDHLKAINLKTLETEIFDKKACAFGYRESVFKHEKKGQYFITEICLKLHKNAPIKDTYGAIRDLLSQKGIDQPSYKDISEVVCEIRKSKLPDPAILGNAGSFFKNPVISEEHYNQLKEKYPTLPSYPAEAGKVKTAAGWLIEQCGWKGKVSGQTGSHKDQALVLVNYGNATGEEIYQCARNIQQDVMDTFGIEFNMEVNII